MSHLRQYRSGTRCLRVAAALLAGLGATDARAQRAYAVDALGNLHTVDFAAGTNTLIGATGAVGTPEALALSPGGTLYATDEAGRLYTVNTTTGAATLVGTTGRGNVEGLDFVGGTLFGVSATGPATLFTIDPATATTTTVLTTTFTSPEPLDFPRTLAFADAATAYYTTRGHLQRLDLGTGATTLVGSTGLAAVVAAVDVLSDGNLYGLTTSGRGVRLNTATGAASILFTVPTSPSWRGITAAPAVSAVPEPATVVLLGAGLLGVGGVAARRRRAA